MSDTAAIVSTHQQIQRLKCAYLASQGMKQADIAQALGPGVGQPTVSRYLQDARKKNELQQQVVWPTDLAAEHRLAIEQSVLSETDREELTTLLDSWRPATGPSPRVGDVHVVHAGDSETGLFGRNAAPLIAQMFKTASVCAVAWGETIKAIVDAIGPYAARQPDLQFIPLCGQPLNHHSDDAITSSNAALELTDLFGAEGSIRFSLRGVPARIPKGIGGSLTVDSTGESTNSGSSDIQQAVNGVLRDFVDTCKDYRLIFGGDAPVISSVDMILTSIGDIAGARNDPLYLDMKESERVRNDDELKSITSGNICGAWLPADPTNQRHLDEVAGLNERWLGIKQQQIIECAARVGFEPDLNAPGVVVVAADPKQANILKQAVGMINTLVISPELAHALIELGRTEAGG